MKYALISVLFLLPLLVKGQQYAAWVRKDSVWSMIDTAGNPIAKERWPMYEPAPPVPARDSMLSEGVLLIASGPQDRRSFRYVEASTGRQLGGRFELGEPFRNGYAMVMIGDTINAIDKQGTLLLKKPIPYMHAFNDAAAILSDRILVLPPAVDKACNCLSSRALFGFVDRNNKLVIAPDLLDADIFVANRAKASEDGRHYGFLGPDDEWAIQPVYEDVSRFEILPD